MSNSTNGNPAGTSVQIGRVEKLTQIIQQAPLEPEDPPHALAEPHPRFVNRVEARAAMTAELVAAQGQERLARLLLHGSPGSGRMDLANKWFEEVRDHFPDGTLLVDFGGASADGTSHLDEALHTALAQLGVPAADIPTRWQEKQAVFRRKLAKRRMLIAVRNVTSPTQVRPLVVASPGSALVVISSAAFGALRKDGFHSVAVEGLEHPHDLELFQKLVYDIPSTVDDRTVEAGVRACGGSPLLIHLLAAQVNDLPTRAERVLRRFAELGPPALDRERGDKAMLGETHRRITALCASLPPHVLMAFRKLGLHPGASPDRAAARAAFG